MIYRIVVNGIEIRYTQAYPHRVYWMSQWEKCWDLLKAGLLTSDYSRECYGHVTVYVPDHILASNV